MIRFGWMQSRRKVIMVAMLCTCAFMSLALSAQEIAEQPKSAWSWDTVLSPQNVFSLAVLIFHFGVLRQEIKDMQARVVKLEKWRDDNAPNEFARKDVLEAQAKAIDSNLTDIKERLHGIERKL